MLVRWIDHGEGVLTSISTPPVAGALLLAAGGLDGAADVGLPRAGAGLAALAFGEAGIFLLQIAKVDIY